MSFRTLLLTVAILVMNLSTNQNLKNGATHLYVAGNSMAAFGAVASIGAFIYGQAMKDDIPFPVLRDQGCAMTRTWSRGVKKRTNKCAHGICSVFRWPAKERRWPSIGSDGTSSTTLIGDDVDYIPFFNDLEIGRPSKVKVKSLQTAAIIWI